MTKVYRKQTKEGLLNDPAGETIEVIDGSGWEANMATLLSMRDCDLVEATPEPVIGPAHRPQSISEIDVRRAVLEDIALKTLYLCGSLSVLELAEKIRLSFAVVSELFFRLRTDQLCQVTGMTGNVPQIAITSQGRARAMELLAQNHYTGSAPVSLESYSEQTRKQSVRAVDVHANDVKRAFAHLVVDSHMLSQFGTALNSGSSIFLYGPAGTGKTTMAETLSRVLAEDEVWIPYAVEVDGEIITVYDSAIHKRVPESEPEGRDERWVLCQRPAVLAGGELTAEMLDLQFNPITKFYVGPMQMKSNNGVLIIDDFGRQRIRPEELLNRWVVPLDRRIDFLTLAGGKKIEIPFEMLVVFASNMDPSELADPSFFRRIQTKIRIGEVTDEQFREIFRRVAGEHRVAFDENIPGDLIDFIHGTLNQELRQCYPRDIVNQVCWAARYEGRKPYIDRMALARAIEAYFPLKPGGKPRISAQEA
jgi:energy-coupling factor transporter ATP-binding protein EcfA2